MGGGPVRAIVIVQVSDLYALIWTMASRRPASIDCTAASTATVLRSTIEAASLRKVDLRDQTHLADNSQRCRSGYAGTFVMFKIPKMRGRIW